MFIFSISDELAVMQKLNVHEFDLGIKPWELYGLNECVCLLRNIRIAFEW